MFFTILNIFIIAILQFIIGILWYSKYLFGNYYNTICQIIDKDFIKQDIKKSFFSLLVSTGINASIIYFITAHIFFLLPSSFFTIAILITLLVCINIINDANWDYKDFRLVILSVAHKFVIIIIGFLFALLFLN